MNTLQTTIVIAIVAVCIIGLITAARAVRVVQRYERGWSSASAGCVKVERVEVKDVALPESMKRSMSRQAEAERERRARVIAADGEYQAATKLAQAAATMAALQVRLLQTIVEVAAEKNSTLVMPFPVKLLRLLDRVTPAASTPAPAVATRRGPRRP